MPPSPSLPPSLCVSGGVFGVCNEAHMGPAVVAHIVPACYRTDTLTFGPLPPAPSRLAYRHALPPSSDCYGGLSVSLSFSLPLSRPLALALHVYAYVHGGRGSEVCIWGLELSSLLKISPSVSSFPPALHCVYVSGTRALGLVRGALALDCIASVTVPALPQVRQRISHHFDTVDRQLCPVCWMSSLCTLFACTPFHSCPLRLSSASARKFWRC
jgi:hypothetical protein